MPTAYPTCKFGNYGVLIRVEQDERLIQIEGINIKATLYIRGLNLE